jgi:hypothetical protein
LRWHEGSFLADGITKNGFDVLITTLIWLPVMISEGFMDRVDVKLVDKLLMGVSVCSCGGHDGLELGLLVGCLEMYCDRSCLWTALGKRSLN